MNLRVTALRDSRHFRRKGFCMKTRPSLVLLALLTLIPALQAYSQAKTRVAVLEFDARGVQFKDIGGKISDGLISKLAGSGNFDLVDRDNLTQIIAEQNLGQAARYDPATAVKIGKLANVNILIMGHVDTFTTDSSLANNPFSLKTYGTLTLRATARVIQVDTGDILEAPSAEYQSGKTLLDGGAYEYSSTGVYTGLGPGLQKLADQAVQSVSQDLAGELRKVLPGAQPGPPSQSVGPKVAGIVDGLVVVNQGQSAGIKVGDTFRVSRQSDTGLKDPDTGQPIFRKRNICTFTVTEVEDTNASGKCDGADAPQSGDLLTPAARP
jgi:hypothetical protein